MTRRGELKAENERLVFIGTPWGERIKRFGVEKETDIDLIIEAKSDIDGHSLNLSRWRGNPEVKLHIERARYELAQALSAAFEEWRADGGHG